MASRHSNPSTVYVSPQREIERLSGALRAWRAWAQFAWLGGGPVEQSDAELRRAVCDRVDVQRSCR